MAASKVQLNISDDSDTTKKDAIECAICLQPCIHPVELPCKHIFCFLCIKGIYLQNQKCALCRQAIPKKCFENPEVWLYNPKSKKRVDSSSSEEDSADDHTYCRRFRWFYEGRHGWWKYDERTNKDVEENFLKGDKTCEVMIAGSLYVIDFDNKTQYRKNEPEKKRKIKRDFHDVATKGVAGLRPLSKSDAQKLAAKAATSSSDSSSCSSDSDSSDDDIFSQTTNDSSQVGNISSPASSPDSSDTGRGGGVTNTLGSLSVSSVTE